MALSNGLIIIIGCALAYAAAKALKNVLLILKGKWNIRQALAGGGMPSSHISTVSSLAGGVFFSEGFSVSLAISLILLGVVIVDAIGVRRSVGRIAFSMNRLSGTRFNETQGHTIPEAIVGLLLGIGIALLMGIVLA
jgi:acid phosphatase family membrane protein YuiD